MKVDELFKNCFSHDEIKKALFAHIMPDLKEGKIVTLDWEYKQFRPSLVYCIMNYLYQETGLSGFKKSVKFKSVPDGQRALLRCCLSSITSMKG